MTELEQSNCDHCGKQTHARYIAIERRIDQIRMLSEDSFADGEPDWDAAVGADWSEDEDADLIEGVEPLDAEEVACYCDQRCWSAAEADWIARLDLRDPYPEEGVMILCSRCSSPIDRTQAHVSYNVIDNEFVTNAAGEESLAVHDATCLAVLCNQCESAKEAEEHFGARAQAREVA